MTLPFPSSKRSKTKSKIKMSLSEKKLECGSPSVKKVWKPRTSRTIIPTISKNNHFTTTNSKDSLWTTYKHTSLRKPQNNTPVTIHYLTPGNCKKKTNKPLFISTCWWKKEKISLKCNKSKESSEVRRAGKEEVLGNVNAVAILESIDQNVLISYAKEAVASSKRVKRRKKIKVSKNHNGWFKWLRVWLTASKYPGLMFLFYSLIWSRREYLRLTWFNKLEKIPILRNRRSLSSSWMQ